MGSAMSSTPDDKLMREALLEATDLSVRFDTEEGPVYAVDKLSFALAPGEVLGVVGESGCGKSMSAMSLVRLLPRNAVVDGSVLFDGVDLLQLPEKQFAGSAAPRSPTSSRSR